MIEVRLFAAAADAAGTEALTLSAADGSDAPSTAVRTVGDVRATLGERFGGELRRVLARCSMLVDGRRADDDEAVGAGSTVDVLPPFAGG